MSKEISGRGRRRSRGVKGNQGVGDFRSINILQFFSIYYYYYYLFIIFSLLFLPTTFTHTHTHDPQPRPMTSTHYPRPTTFSYTRETPPELFEKSCGLFYILFELTNEKMKEIRPTPNITARLNGYLTKGEK